MTCIPPARTKTSSPVLPFLCGKRAVADASALAREFGCDAGMAAALRAAQNRGRDNSIGFCHWREVERLVAWLDADSTGVTRH